MQIDCALISLVLVTPLVVDVTVPLLEVGFDGLVSGGLVEISGSSVVPSVVLDVDELGFPDWLVEPTSVVPLEVDGSVVLGVVVDSIDFVVWSQCY